MSIFHQNLEIRDTKTKRGKGVYSKVALPAGQIILEFKGEIIEKKNVKDYMEYLQITESTYLGLSGELDDYVNHSCSPNCGLLVTELYLFLFGTLKLMLRLPLIIARPPMMPKMIGSCLVFAAPLIVEKRLADINICLQKQKASTKIKKWYLLT